VEPGKQRKSTGWGRQQCLGEGGLTGGGNGEGKGGGRVDGAGVETEEAPRRRSEET